MRIIVVILILACIFCFISKCIKYLGYIVLFIAFMYGVYHLYKLARLISKKREYDKQYLQINTNEKEIADENNNTNNTVTPSTLNKAENNMVVDNKNHASICNNYSKEQFDTFMWQCNSISKLRDSEDTGYEYTTLENPNDLLEVGYRDALLDVSDYDSIPLINYKNDKYAPGGYVQREMIDWKRDYEKYRNIFEKSNIPIVCEMQTIIRCIDTMVFKSVDGDLGKNVQETFYYRIPKQFQPDFLDIVNKINISLKENSHEEMTISLKDIVFTITANKYTKYSLPLSLIIYDTEKRIFTYRFSNEMIIPGEFSPTYKNTETGDIIYTEDAVLKKANFIKIIDGNRFICRFKNYKSGFDLYDIRSNGSVIYKRNK